MTFLISIFIHFLGWIKSKVWEYSVIFLIFDNGKLNKIIEQKTIKNY